MRLVTGMMENLALNHTRARLSGFRCSHWTAVRQGEDRELRIHAAPNPTYESSHFSARSVSATRHETASCHSLAFPRSLESMLTIWKGSIATLRSGRQDCSVLSGTYLSTCSLCPGVVPYSGVRAPLSTVCTIPSYLDRRFIFV